MKAIIKLTILFACFGANNFAQSSEGVNQVTITIDGLASQTPAELVSLPALVAEPRETTIGSGSAWRQYLPGQQKFAGLLVLERPLPNVQSTWYTWFDDTADGQASVQKNITVSFTTKYLTNQFELLNCFPVTYQLCSRTSGGYRATNSLVERMEVMIGFMDY